LLGVVLFERTKRRVDVTPRGAALLRQAELLLADARRLTDAARRSAEPLTGELRLGAIATLAPYYLPALIRGGRARFPRLALRIKEALTDELLEALRAGELDAALVALPVTEAGLTSEALFFEPFLLACPVDHPLATAPIPPMRELPRGDLLLMEDGHCLRDQALAICPPTRNDASDGYAATSLHTLVQMVASGLGTTLLPRLAVEAGVTSGADVTLRPLAGRGAWRTLGLAWRPDSPREQDYRALGRALGEVCGSDENARGSGGTSGQATPND
jgi:LysR family hydrogen peroxide-inducible transcriptional activator